MVDQPPMGRLEGWAWLLLCNASCLFFRWLDARPGDGLAHYLEGAMVACVVAVFVILLKPPLRWWIATALVFDLLWLRLHLLAGRLGHTLAKLPDLTDQPVWLLCCWCGTGFAAGWLYAARRGWSVAFLSEDFTLAAHCLFWGAVIGPALLLDRLRPLMRYEIDEAAFYVLGVRWDGKDTCCVCQRHKDVRPVADTMLGEGCAYVWIYHNGRTWVIRA